jgi:hypothetical protein
MASPQATVFLVAICHTCPRYHEIHCTPINMLGYLSEWQEKHPPPVHDIEFVSTKRYVPPKIAEGAFVEANEAPWWLAYPENVDIKVAYAASAAFTFGPHATPLASSATLVIGRESTAVSNTSNLYLGYGVGGTMMTGTSPTAGRIELYLYGSINDTPLYPAVLDGTDSDETFADVDERNACVTFLSDAVTTSTSNRAYYFRWKNIAPYFAGLIPKNFGVWATHNTVAALNSTAGNHIMSYTGAYITG